MTPPPQPPAPPTAPPAPHRDRATTRMRRTPARALGPALGWARREPIKSWCTAPLLRLGVAAAAAAIVGAPWTYVAYGVLIAPQVLVTLCPGLVESLKQRARDAQPAEPATQPAPAAGPASELAEEPADQERAAIIAQIPAQSAAAIEEALATVRERFEAADAATAFHTCGGHDGHDGHDGHAECDFRWSAAIVPPHGPHGPVLVLGDRLTTSPAPLRFVLAHELHHWVRPLKAMARIRLQLLTMAWVPLGLFVPMPAMAVTAAALWLVLLASHWAEEIICDVAAARRYDGRAWCRAYRTALPRRPWWRILIQAMPPTHPPVGFRAWYITRIPVRDLR